MNSIATPDRDLLAEIAKLRAENARLAKVKATHLSCKVSEKGALSVYGMGRFPTTLYKEQWLKLLAASDDIKAFITANENRLSVKQ